MADRYWVGGTGTWDATTTTNWSATSGGASGASAPTSVDNVIFDSSSNVGDYSVTIGLSATPATCENLSISFPLVGVVTIISAATSVINVHGSLLVQSSTVFTTTSGAAINFLAATTGKTVITNNVNLGTMTVTFSNSTGGWTLGSAITTTGSFNVTSGTFDTGADYAVNVSGFSSSGGTFKSITLNSSVITTTATGGFQIATTATNLTFSGASSTIICSNGSPTFGGLSGLTYGTVRFTSATLVTVGINGANTYTDLIFTSRTTDGIGALVFSGDQVVTGTLTVGTANTAVRRLWLRSSAVGTQRTFTVAAIATLSDVDFRDIVAAGAAGTWSGTRLGNCRNNSNITFNAGTTKYLRSIAGASAAWSGVVWSTSSSDTATPVVTDFPLAQDTCIIDDAGATTNNGLRTGNTVTINANWNIGTLDLSGRTVAFNWTQTNLDPAFYGNVTLTTAMTMVTVTGSPTWTFCGQGAIQTLNSAGIIIRLNQLFVDSPGWGLTLAVNTEVDLSPITLPNNTGSFILTSGTLDITDKVLTTVVFSCGAGANTIAFGTTGNITTTLTIAGTVFTGSLTTTVTGTPQVIVSANTSAARTITPGAVTEANSISFRISAGTGGLTTSTGSYRDLDFTDGVNPTGFGGALGGAIATIYGNFKASTNMTQNASTSALIFAATSGTKTINTAGVTFDRPFTFNGIGGTWVMQDALTLGSTQALTLTNGTLQLKSGTTNTVGSLVTTGATQKFLQSTTPGTQATISAASGTNSVSYLTIQDSNATGGATWYALAPSVDAGNNTGWIFFPTPADSNEITMRLRSFTQPRRF